MFIRKSGRGGYDRHGQQRSGRGQYLALFSWNDYKALDELRSECTDCRALWEARSLAIEAGDHTAYARAYHCEAHQGIRSGLGIPLYPNGREKLYACVRACSLSQCGHFMMGSIRIGQKYLTVSGPIGNDGLPMDLQDVPKDQRSRLVELPEAIATVYWSDNGHNDVGSAGPTLRGWALETFK